MKARIQTDVSFRVGGKVIERPVDVGSRVRAGDVLARIENAEQRADVDIARAGLQSAQATVKQKTLAFERYKALLQSRAIAQATFDLSQEELLTAQGSLQVAEAALATAQDASSYTELKADADGVITARNIEVGQVVSAAQAAFTLAHDGPREAVFNVFEAFFLEGRPQTDVDVASINDRAGKVKTTIREVSPTIDTKAGTVRVKVVLPQDAQWPLGTTVVGEFRSLPRKGIVLPSSAMASAGGMPAVWIIDTASRSVSLRKVSVSRYQTSDFIVTGGITPQDLIVTDGGKFLREGQAVVWEVK
ncbi:acriflavin resistance protein [Mesorhizobium albiziae]|nr:acriflavin resistance protein [Mesorhizobium albiziae]